MAGIGNDLVREARRRAGLTQRELAGRAGTTQSAIARIETGRSTPTFDTVLRLVSLCDLDLDIMLVERDASDWSQAQRLLGLSPSQRVERHARILAGIRVFQEAGEATRAT
ncbi:MAG: helix-turn-helix domain-containing protein [Actinomycetota bacterium]|jgi:transcriptional regulator with XRE-family HTH domain|nr:helix-turn-helix domain-containing protein [Actinomycetota bacterium]MDQ3528060.1 helix-turn-helix domain-containing protein [Actinomycetota bacterium]